MAPNTIFPYYDTHAKFAISHFMWLFGFKSDGHALFIGTGWKSWADVFYKSSFCSRSDNLSTIESNYDAIFYDSSTTDSNRGFIADLKKLNHILKPSGRMVITVHNFYSLYTKKKDLLNLIHGSQTIKPRIGFYGLKRALSKVGLNNYQILIPMPNLHDMEELFFSDSSLLELPGYQHFYLHLAKKLGIYHLFANNFIVFKNPQPFFSLPFIDNALVKNNSAKQFQISYSLKRIDLRARGALVLFIRTELPEKQFVLRVVDNLKTETIVKRNHQFLRKIHYQYSIPNQLKRVIPFPLNISSYDGRTIFSETMLPGIPAWKLNRGVLCQKIFNEASNFIITLNYSTRFLTTFSPQVIDELLNYDINLIESCSGTDRQLLERITQLAKNIRSNLLGKTGFLAISHGDYGYGNILINPISGKISGVIDWDTGREQEFVGIDHINLQIQKHRNENSTNFIGSFLDVASKIFQRGCIDSNGIYLSMFGIKDIMLPEMIAVAFLRYMSRAAQYPEIFVGEQYDYLQAIQLFDEMAVK